MSVGYVDSSCLTAVALGEPGHEDLAQVLDAYEVLFSSGLLEAEVRAAMQREGLEPSLVDDYIGEVEWVLPARTLSGEISTAQEAGRLKGADLWHVASALFARASIQGELAFLTLDEPQRLVASELGFDAPALI